MVYGHVITKFSRMGRLPHFLSYGAPPTRALRLLWSRNKVRGAAKREPIKKLGAICQRHDIKYSQAKSLEDKHKPDDEMLDEISKIPYKDRPWGIQLFRLLLK